MGNMVRNPFKRSSPEQEATPLLADQEDASGRSSKTARKAEADKSGSRQPSKPWCSWCSSRQPQQSPKPRQSQQPPKPWCSWCRSRQPQQAPDESWMSSRPRTSKPSMTREEAGPPFELEEAQQLLSELRQAFKEKTFQLVLTRTREKYPLHDKKGHLDNVSYMADLQKLMLSVYNKVLPKEPWCLSSGWLGARQMVSRMAGIADHPVIRSLQNSIDALISCDLNGAALEEPLVYDTPNGNGGIVEYDLPFVKDSNGDAAHEFWVMDRGTLRQVKMAGPRTVVQALLKKEAAEGKKDEKAAGGPAGGKAQADGASAPEKPEETKAEKKKSKKTKKNSKAAADGAESAEKTVEVMD